MEQGFVMLGAAAPLPPEHYGLKASWLARASQAGERVPEGFCIDAPRAAQVAAGDSEACALLRTHLAALQQACAGAPIFLAVRSSPPRSLPGALLTLTHVPCELDAVRTALQKVLASCQLPAAREQLAAQQHSVPVEPWLGVVVQRYLALGAPADFGAVALTRDPTSGERRLRGEYSSAGAQAVVSGRARPRPLEAVQVREAGDALEAHDPAALTRIKELAQRLERLFDQPLELELAHVAGELWLLQVRALGLSPRALVKVALDAIDADSPRYGLFLDQLAGHGLDSFAERHFSEGSALDDSVLARGVAASMGVASGVVVTDVQRAIERARHEPVVLLRPDAIPEDVAAFRVAQAVVTTSGGLTCHAAVIARGLGVPAVVGCAGVRVDLAGRQLWGGRDAARVVAREGDWVSVDARRGLLHRGVLPVETRLRDAELRRLFAEVRKLRPTPLWVGAEAELALQLKEQLSLDGALCSWPEQGDLPPGRGRECWIELAASEVEQRVGAVPAGWGVVVCGEPAKVRIAALRKLSPLRAFGLRLEGPDDLQRGNFDERLELLVLGPGFAPADNNAPGRLISPAIDTARVLRLVTFPERVPVPAGDNVGWVCQAAGVAAAALRYASVRAGSTSDAGGGISTNSLAGRGEP